MDSARSGDIGGSDEVWQCASGQRMVCEVECSVSLAASEPTYTCGSMFTEGDFSGCGWSGQWSAPSGMGQPRAISRLRSCAYGNDGVWQGRAVSYTSLPPVVSASSMLIAVDPDMCIDFLTICAEPISCSASELSNDEFE